MTEDDLPQPTELARDVVVATATAAASAFLGPELAIPIAAAGAMIPHVGKVLSSQMLSRVDRVYEGVTAGGLDLERLADVITEDERAMDLWRRVIRAGLETPWQTKARALGRALAEGTLRDKGFDRDARVVKALDAIEEWDFAMLDFIDRLPDRRTNEEAKQRGLFHNGPRVASIDDLREGFPVDDVVDFVVEHLENSGLIDRLTATTYGGSTVAYWMPTRIADEALQLLRAAAEDER